MVRIKAPSEWSAGPSAYCCLIYPFMFYQKFRDVSIKSLSMQSKGMANVL